MIATRGGVPILLRSVAEIEDSSVRHKVSVDGHPAHPAVYKQSGANTVHMSDGAWREIERIHRDYPKYSICGDESRWRWSTW